MSNEDIERERLELERERLAFDIDRVGFDAAHSFAKDGIRHLILINGAAVVALLAFLGRENGATTGAADAKKLAWAMILFGAGVVAGAICSLVAYLFQTVVREAKDKIRTAWRLRFFGIGAAVVGVVLFVAGLALAACAFGSA